MTDNDDLRERVERAIEAALCKDAGRETGAIWRSTRGREQVRVCAQAALSATPIEALQQRVERLEVALRPFAEVGKLIEYSWGESDGPLGVLDGHALVETLNSRDFRIALAALGDDVG